jgi:hypothetical protein
MQPEEEPFAAPLDNILPWRPSDSIELFAGPMSYRSDQVGNLPSVPGKICFWLRSGSHVQWSVDLDAVDPAIAEEWRLPMPDHSLGELRFDFLDRPMTLGAHRQSSGYGFIPGGLGRFGSTFTPVRVIAHWINVPNLRGQTLLGRPATHGRMQRWLGRWEIDLGPWHVMIDSRDDLDQIYRAAKRNYLAVLTHTMEIRRQDHAPFSGEEAEHLLDALHLGFSFAMNRWAAPLLPIGFDSATNRFGANGDPCTSTLQVLTLWHGGTRTDRMISVSS